MKIIGQGESNAVLVSMTREEWAMLSGYRDTTTYLDGGWNFNTGIVKEMTKTLEQIRWMRSFATTMIKHATELETCELTMRKTAALFAELEMAKPPQTATEAEICNFKGTRPLIRPVQPDMAGLHTDGGFDMYPHVNPVTEKVGIAPDAEL
jgi:hypothetical protein